MTKLEVKNLAASVNGKQILKDVSFTINGGEIHALMGPNGAGKSTLGYVLIGHPNYEVLHGSIKIDGVELADKLPEERARAGLFLAYQTPVAVQGVKLSTFLRLAYNQLHPDEKIKIQDFHALLKKYMNEVGLDETFISRSVNEGFSGGERKRVEILQMMILRPKFVVLDEIDSGLDVDALKMVADEIRKFYSKDVGFLIITHYQRILKNVEPQFVHVLVDGKIAKEGGNDISLKIEEEGYDWIRSA
ncbi:MAG: Fe-S cluster assembly ATPase SufC [Candidatus Thermoplasmatota archaeon]|jgi:Fe-S cluster assembly ATP-binding protein|nr:Fe-S cluster assembly ATPase SufC [Candidatus Thermoplasmatota archaeon]